MLARLAPPRLTPPPPWAVEMAAGYVFWIVFLLILEPGNILRAHQAGRDLAVDHEVLRIAAAAALGATASPLALWLSRRLYRTHLVRLVSALAAISAGLIVISCFLAAWFFQHTWAPGLDDIAEMLTGNSLLVLFALVTLCALGQAAMPRARAPEIAPPRPDVLRSVMVKTRGGQVLIALDGVDWIESQGNYVALHAGASTHLVRGPLATFAGRLDPGRFVRIHRSAVVAVERIASVEWADNGDGRLWLRDGTELKISRNHRQALRQAWRQG